MNDTLLRSQKNTGVRKAAVAALGAVSAAAAALLFAGPAANAQLLAPAPDPQTGAQIGRPTTAPINAARDVSLDQKLDTQVSLNTPFRDESGRTVPLGTYFASKPVLLVMPFYKCPGICTAELDGMVKTFEDDRLKYKIGRDFEVVTVSINPKEGPELAAAKKKEYLNLLSQPGASDGWHFLTGDESSIRKLAGQVGFRYVFDPKTEQYAHPAGLILLTPGGKVSKYFYGVEYSPKDLRLALTDAGQGKVGSLADKFVLYCYHYDPARGSYGLAVFRIVQVGCFATVLVLGTFMFFAFRKDYRDTRVFSSGTAAGGAPTPTEKQA